MIVDNKHEPKAMSLLFQRSQPLFLF